MAAPARQTLVHVAARDGAVPIQAHDAALARLRTPLGIVLAHVMLAHVMLAHVPSRAATLRRNLRVSRLRTCPPGRLALAFRGPVCRSAAGWRQRSSQGRACAASLGRDRWYRSIVGGHVKLRVPRRLIDGRQRHHGCGGTPVSRASFFVFPSTFTPRVLPCTEVPVNPVPITRDCTSRHTLGYPVVHY